MKVAIVGSGIAGVSAAFHLNKAGHQTSIFEKANYFGGHTDTHQFEIDGKNINIDSGFIVFAREFYPHFSRMLDELGIDSKPTAMSFSASNTNTGLVYNTTSINKLFCQRKNLFSAKFYRMLFDIVRFYQSGDKILLHTEDTITANDYFSNNHYSQTFTEDHIYPMISALWSTPVALVKFYPIRYLVEYMQTHGMMKLTKRPTWQVLNNGSFEYQHKLKKHMKHCTWRLNCGVTNIIREENQVLIHLASAEPEYFDAVVLACHADQAYILLQKPSVTEREILTTIGFENNDVTIHTDDNVMPENPLAWASWNAWVSPDNNTRCSATYWMNELQGLDSSTNFFISLNESREINSEKILKKRHYQHPSYTARSVVARKRLPEINGQNRTAYAGAYWGWAFHEDGARTGYEAAHILMERHSNQSN